MRADTQSSDRYKDRDKDRDTKTERDRDTETDTERERWRETRKDTVHTEKARDQDREKTHRGQT